jgi:hypothetical protein
MNSLSELKQLLIDAILFSKTIPGFPTGLFLTVDEIRLLENDLSDEHRIEHSAGRYRGIAVYDIASIELGENELQGVHQGIVFKYVPMLCVF